MVDIAVLATNGADRRSVQHGVVLLPGQLEHRLAGAHVVVDRMNDEPSLGRDQKRVSAAAQTDLADLAPDLVGGVACQHEPDRSRIIGRPGRAKRRAEPDHDRVFGRVEVGFVPLGALEHRLAVPAVFKGGVVEAELSRVDDVLVADHAWRIQTGADETGRWLVGDADAEQRRVVGHHLRQPRVDIGRSQRSVAQLVGDRCGDPSGVPEPVVDASGDLDSASFGDRVGFVEDLTLGAGACLAQPRRDTRADDQTDDEGSQ